MKNLSEAKDINLQRFHLPLLLKKLFEMEQEGYSKKQLNRKFLNTCNIKKEKDAMNRRLGSKNGYLPSRDF